ncbi:hypothetical protein AAC387_Pa10g0521 [Persea americana]
MTTLASGSGRGGFRNDCARFKNGGLKSGFEEGLEGSGPCNRHWRDFRATTARASALATGGAWGDGPET